MVRGLPPQSLSPRVVGRPLELSDRFRPWHKVKRSLADLSSLKQISHFSEEIVMAVHFVNSEFVFSSVVDLHRRIVLLTALHFDISIYSIFSFF